MAALAAALAAAAALAVVAAVAGSLYPLEGDRAMVDWMTLSAVWTWSGFPFPALLSSEKAFLVGVPIGEDKAAGRVTGVGDSTALAVDFLTGVVVAESGFNLGTYKQWGDVCC